MRVWFIWKRRRKEAIISTTSFIKRSHYQSFVYVGRAWRRKTRDDFFSHRSHFSCQAKDSFIFQQWILQGNEGRWKKRTSRYLYFKSGLSTAQLYLRSSLPLQAIFAHKRNGKRKGEVERIEITRASSDWMIDTSCPSHCSPIATYVVASCTCLRSISRLVCGRVPWNTSAKACLHISSAQQVCCSCPCTRNASPTS